MSFHGGAHQGAKALNFKATFGRVFRLLLLDRVMVLSLLAFGVVGVTLSVIGPKILGHATDLIFNGFVSSLFPETMTKAEAVASLQADGQDQLATVAGWMDLNPGHGTGLGAPGSDGRKLAKRC